MCEYCGCRDITIIGRLSEEHYGAVNALGALGRAIESVDRDEVGRAIRALSSHLFPHNMSEEASLFRGLCKPEYCDYYGATVDGLKEEHCLMREQVGKIAAGHWDVYPEFEITLRQHIDKEENGLFPATAVTLDGETWDEIDEWMHEFDHANDRPHEH